MEQSQLNWIANFIWGIADDVLRDLYVRGKYRDVILPMTVLRRLDAVLEPTKQAVLDMKTSSTRQRSPTRTRHCGRPPVRPFTTRRCSPCATSKLARAADEIESGTYLLYDGACGTGGMLTVAEETLKRLAEQHGKQVATHLYGQEINAETYAICKADLLLKGEGDAADNIVGGPAHSTLSNDAFPSREFDFMLSNPPYGKSWKSDQERMGGKQGIKDPRFLIEHAGDVEYSLITRSSDGQMPFLANMLTR
jgi:type I restriction-modification system DNA methylase subunit